MDMSNPSERDKLLKINADLKPPRISEIVLKTAQYEVMKTWYSGVFGLGPFYENNPEPGAQVTAGQMERATDVRLCFIRLNYEHPFAQVVAIFEIPGTRSEPSGDPGLHHMQFRNADMDELFARYERLKAMGIVPHRTANHGPGTSFYYRDPDQNIVELSANNFATVGEYLGYFKTESYQTNPSGIEIDADAYIARYRSGVPLTELVKI